MSVLSYCLFSSKIPSNSLGKIYFMFENNCQNAFFPPNTIIYLSLVSYLICISITIYLSSVSMCFLFSWQQSVTIFVHFLRSSCEMKLLIFFIKVIQRPILSIQSKQQKKTHCKFAVSLMLYDLTNLNGCNLMMFGQKSGKFWNWNFSDTFMNCKTTDTFWCLDRIKSLFK